MEDETRKALDNIDKVFDIKKCNEIITNICTMSDENRLSLIEHSYVIASLQTIFLQKAVRVLNR